MLDELYRSKAFDVNDPDPQAIAKAVIDSRAATVRADVATHIVTSKGVKAVQDDKKKCEELFRILVERKLLSDDDVKAALSAPEGRLSMANKISKYQHVILDERIVSYLEPGYSVLYQLVGLYEDLEEEDGQD